MLGIVLSLIIGILIWRCGWFLATVCSDVVKFYLYRIRPKPAFRTAGRAADDQGGSAGSVLNLLLRPVSRGYASGGLLTAILAGVYMISMLILVGEAMRTFHPLFYYGGPMAVVQDWLWWPMGLGLG